MQKVSAHGFTVPGFDVSHYQPNFDFQKARLEGNLFCFLKATEGSTYVDKSFTSHWKNAKSAGLLVGAYHFFHPQSDPIQQAKHFAQVVGPLSAEDLPCVLDWETTDNVPSAQDRLEAMAFLNEVKILTKKNPIIYTGPYFAEALKLGTDFKQFPLWVAHYGTKAPLVPDPWKIWSFWQYTDDQGIDKNIFNGSFDRLKALTA